MQPNNPLYLEFQEKTIVEENFERLSSQNVQKQEQLQQFLIDKTIKLSKDEFAVFKKQFDPENIWHLEEHDDILASPRYANLQRLMGAYDTHLPLVKKVLENIWNELLQNIGYIENYLPYHNRFDTNNFDVFLEKLGEHTDTYSQAIDPYFIENYFHNPRTSMYIDHAFFNTQPESDMFPAMIYQYTKHIITYLWNALLKQALKLLLHQKDDVLTDTTIPRQAFGLLKSHVPPTIEEIYDVDQMTNEQIEQVTLELDTFYNFDDPWINLVELLMELPYKQSFLDKTEDEKIETFIKYFFEMRKLYLNHIEIYMTSIQEIDVKRSMMKEDFPHWGNYPFPEHLDALRKEILPKIKYATVYKRTTA